MKYSLSLPLESFTYQAQNLTYCNVLSNLDSHSHPQAMTTKCWMEWSLSTACPLLQWVHSVSMRIMFLSLICRGSYRILRGWMLYGIHTQSEGVHLWKKEDKVFAGKCQAKQRYQAIEWIFYGIHCIRRSFLPFWHLRLKSSNGLQPKLCISHQGKLYLPWVPTAPWAVAIMRK